MTVFRVLNDAAELLVASCTLSCRKNEQDRLVFVDYQTQSSQGQCLVKQFVTIFLFRPEYFPRGYIDLLIYGVKVTQVHIVVLIA